MFLSAFVWTPQNQIWTLIYNIFRNDKYAYSSLLTISQFNIYYLYLSIFPNLYKSTLSNLLCTPTPNLTTGTSSVLQTAVIPTRHIYFWSNTVEMSRPLPWAVILHSDRMTSLLSWHIVYFWMSAKHMLQEGGCGHMDVIRMLLSYYMKNNGRQEDKNAMMFHRLDNSDLWLKHLLEF